MTLSLKTPNASALKSKLHAILIYFLETKAPTENKIQNASCEDNKEDDGAALVEWWDISLGRGFDDLHNTIAVGQDGKSAQWLAQFGRGR